MNGKVNGSTQPTREQIAARAYAIWEQEGRPFGREIEHWLRAERELMPPNGRSQGRAAPPKQARPPRQRKPPSVDERAFRIFQ
jgi:hypothetical protein